MTYFAPSYLAAQKLIPKPVSGFAENMSVSRINPDYAEKEKDEFEKERILAAGEYRRQQIHQQ
jgi:hypothetical protein